MNGQKNENRLGEAVRFAVSGGVCFLIEFAALVLLRDRTGLDTLIAVPAAFLISVIVNYLMCVRWVFPAAGEQRNAARLGFLVTSVMGLLLNEGLMLLFRKIFGEDGILLTVGGLSLAQYMVNKVLATLIVMVWNYFTKRWILYKK
ncbi:MAG: GtrA family protein [Clostridia bacterium]|nr:GtrA family protein [Clostridia bacterium]MBQ6721567.1 GtrA family protein [Clostridia bacterium]MBQ9401449.1 GtrA family protein [Clostridia bacterium]